jgi:hypothetical protein
MFTLTAAEGLLLTGGWLGLTVALLLGVFRFLPRSRRPVPAYVRCPMLGRHVGAQLARDEWTRRYGEVLRCDLLGRCAIVTCNQGCLKAPVVPLAGV